MKYKEITKSERSKWGKVQKRKQCKKNKIKKNELRNEKRLLKGNKVRVKSATMPNVKRKHPFFELLGYWAKEWTKITKRNTIGEKQCKNLNRKEKSRNIARYDKVENEMKQDYWKEQGKFEKFKNAASNKKPQQLHPVRNWVKASNKITKRKHRMHEEV